jgi:uncharacterized phage protein (TIGR01671 family)
MVNKSKMMETYKFRGKRSGDGKWMYGSLIGNDVIVGDIVEFNDEWFNTEWWYKVTAETVGQYTGLKDSTGKEIFEGDIVTIGNDLKAVVIWFNGSFRFKDELSCKATYLNDIGTVIRDYDVCIIGNIHDNPELLKGGK